MRNRKNIYLVILLLLIISIGFAYLSTNLSISGIGKFKPNTWDVHFENVVVDLDNTEENSTASISSDRHTVNFDISLNEPGSSYSLYVDVVNAGTIDAMFDDFIVQGVPDNLQNIISLEYSYNDNGIISKYDLLPKKSSQKIRVIVNYLDPEDETFLPQEDGSLNVSIQLNYLQADEKAITRIKKDSAADKIITLSKSDTSIVEDTTKDKNLRYVGANPNNYVLFNGELWRIIGVFNNTLDKYGTKTSRVKLMKNTDIGAYSWHSTNTSINAGYGVNNWGTSSAAELLNTKYYNSNKGLCYVAAKLQTGDCDFTQTGIKNDSKKYIENAVWDTSIVYWDVVENNTALGFYNAERSGNITVGCSPEDGFVECTDTFKREATWIGKIGLPSISDIVFSTSGGTDKTRTECWETPYVAVDYTNVQPYDYSCVDNMWYRYNYKDEEDTIVFWTMTGVTSKNSRYSARTAFHFSVNPPTAVHSSNGGYAQKYLPTIYLDENVKISGGFGTESEPFQLSM